MVGNHSQSVKVARAQAARHNSSRRRSGLVIGGFAWKAIAQRIKATLGITGNLPRVHIDREVYAADVGSSHPGAVVGPKVGLFAH